MSWDLLPFFEDDFISIIPITVESTTGSTGFPVDVETPQDATSGLLWTASDATKSFNITFKEDVADVLVLNDVTNITNSGKIQAANYEYSVDSIQNVAYQDDLFVVGLKDKR